VARSPLGFHPLNSLRHPKGFEQESKEILARTMQVHEGTGLWPIDPPVKG
jgi:hypothetical protein